MMGLTRLYLLISIITYTYKKGDMMKEIGRFHDRSDDTFWVQQENGVVVITWRDDKRCTETQILLFEEDAYKLANLLLQVEDGVEHVNPYTGRLSRRTP
jgi:hypothetical protein